MRDIFTFDTFDILGAVMLAVNCVTMFLTFPTKRSVRFSAGFLSVFAVAFVTLATLVDVTGMETYGLRGLFFLPVMLWLFRGQVFQKVFAFFLQYFLTVLQRAVASAVTAIFLPAGGVYNTVA